MKQHPSILLLLDGNRARIEQVFDGQISVTILDPDSPTSQILFKNLKEKSRELCITTPRQLTKLGAPKSMYFSREGTIAQLLGSLSDRGIAVGVTSIEHTGNETEAAEMLRSLQPWNASATVIGPAKSEEVPRQTNWWNTLRRKFRSFNKL